uniref:Cora-domain-containing protein n=1 Tax=Mycena chlorophos TaxID=658473 RepID=A0ABQ0LUM7_MYCCL|nr:predicted protein [Mycena chlorophos]
MPGARGSVSRSVHLVFRPPPPDQRSTLPPALRHEALVSNEQHDPLPKEDRLDVACNFSVLLNQFYDIEHSCLVAVDASFSTCTTTMSSPSHDLDDDVVMATSPISITGGSPLRRRTSTMSDEVARSRHSPTLARSFDPNDPEVRERQRTMDVQMAIELSMARRDTTGIDSSPEIPFAPLSNVEQHDIDVAQGQSDSEEPPDAEGSSTPAPTFIEINHMSAHDPSMLAKEAHINPVPQPPIFGGLPTYHLNASDPEFDFGPLEEFSAAEKIRLDLAAPKFALPALKARTVAPNADDIAAAAAAGEDGEGGPSDSDGPRRKLSQSKPRPRHQRKGGGRKLALFEGTSGEQFGLDGVPAVHTTTGIPGILHSGHDRPYRFSFYSNSLSTTVHARSLSELPAEGQSFSQLFAGVSPANSTSSRPARPGPSPLVNDKTSRHSNYKAPGEHPRHSANDTEAGTWWLDIQSPTDEEMKMLSKVFSIHPLTTEDIQMEETREKIELFRHYYFVCFRSFDQDPYSPTHLEPLNMYIIVFREGTLSFHFRPTPHPQNVRRRIKQLRDYISVTSDWISYALIDDITDAFGPLIQGIEYEVDSIDELVLILKDAETSDMLRRIGTCRKKVMGLLRLMGNKADVVKGLAKRCNEHWRVAPTSDIGLYLSDIQDHLITMTQNLNHYEKILSRSHSNYLAQISIEMTEANNQINDVLSKLTALGTVLIPMNLVTGLWGMNVHVPGQNAGGYGWFLAIIGSLLAFAVVGGAPKRPPQQPPSPTKALWIDRSLQQTQALLESKQLPRTTYSTNTMSSVSSSTTSLVSSSSSSESSRSSSSTKDYAAAFASLQSSFGLNGMAPRAVPKQLQPKKAKVAIAPGYVAPALPKNKSEGKNYEAAFGALSSHNSWPNKPHQPLGMRARACVYAPPLNPPKWRACPALGIFRICHVGFRLFLQ